MVVDLRNDGHLPITIVDARFVPTAGPFTVRYNRRTRPSTKFRLPQRGGGLVLRRVLAPGRSEGLAIDFVEPPEVGRFTQLLVVAFTQPGSGVQFIGRRVVASTEAYRNITLSSDAAKYQPLSMKRYFDGPAPTVVPHRAATQHLLHHALGNLGVEEGAGAEACETADGMVVVRPQPLPDYSTRGIGTLPVADIETALQELGTDDAGYYRRMVALLLAEEAQMEADIITYVVAPQ